jgi:predicted acetyltransferase
MHIDLVPAMPSQEPILANLLQLYAHDFSEFKKLDLGEDGRFGYKDLPLYFRDSKRHPFLVRKDGRWAGLIFVQRGSQISGDENVWDVAEFFVIRGYRRCGVGTEIAHRVWRQFPGRWEVRVLEANVSAQRFWERAISQYTGEDLASVRINKNRDRWRVFSFVSPQVASLPINL